MRILRLALTLLSMGILAACASIPITGDPAAQVTALAETVPVGTTDEDAADDPAIWFNTSNPAASLIIGTDKKAGLHVYGLDGSQKSFLDAGLMNNVDLVELADGTILVTASDRTEPSTAHIYLANLNSETGALTPLGRYPVGAGEGYGICMAQPDADGTLRVFSPVKNGAVMRTDLTRTGNTWQAPLDQASQTGEPA